MAWFKKKNLCVHCNTQKTKREFEGSHTCADCEIEILMSREEIRNCLIDGTQMKKEQYKQIIIDRCPTCNGVWLDGGELKTLKDIGDSELTTAFVLGVVR